MTLQKFDNTHYLEGVLAKSALWCASTLLLLTAACTSEDVVSEERLQHTTLTVTLSMQPSSRAIGDYIPELPALERENDIDNLFIWFYRGASGPNGDAEVLYSTLVRRDKISETSYGTRKFSIPLYGYEPEVGDRILAVANMGDMSRYTTLAEIREAIAPAAWSGPTPTATGFAMASARDNDGIIEPAYNSTSETAYRSSLTIERLAARIDISFKPSNVSPEGLYYTTPASDKVYITHAIPTNVMQHPTYVLKHVTDNAGENCFSQTSVCGFEMIDENTGYPSNYVVEPTTATKGDASDLAALYGTTAAASIQAGDFASAPAIGSMLGDSRLVINENGSKALVLAYANENTQHHTLSDSRFTTGLMLRAEYEPAKLLTADGSTIDYTRGSDFYRLQPADEDAEPLFFATRSDAETYRDAHGLQSARGIDCFAKGICYYHVWIKHRNIAQSGLDTRFPMEYGIVRNHVYRLSFRISGPGYPQPELIEPENIRASIFVRPWSFRKLEETIM